MIHRKSALFSLSLGMLFSAVASAAPAAIEVKIDSTANTSGNGSIEACGTARAKTPGVAQPILVTLQHTDSTYTTLAGANGKWCILFKRWTNDGQFSVDAQFFGPAQNTN